MIRRRLITVPGYFLIWLLWLGASPIWIALAIVVDLIRQSRGVALRSAAVVTVYLSCEVIGLFAGAALWIWRWVGGLDSERWTDLHFRLESWWGSTIFRSIVLLFGLRLKLEGEQALASGPYLLLVRHASAGDTLLASMFVSQTHGIRLRYVLKRELLWDPCLDIVGNRLPNVFVDRFSNDSAREVRRVQELARGLGPRDGILIYPEGSRFTNAKRSRAIDRFEQSGDTGMFDYTSSLKFVLPPRPGGVLGLLDAAPEVDVVICAHTGFEGAASLAQIWNGALLNRELRVQFRRIPREKIPTDGAARVLWIFAEWRKVDAFVDRYQNREDC